MAGGVSIGPRLQVEGEEEFRQKIMGVIEQSKTLDAEMKALTATFGEEDTAQQRAAKSTDLLNMQLDAAKERTRLVREMTMKSAETTEENSTQTLKWRQALAAAEEQQAKLERAVEENTRALGKQNEEIDTTADLFKKFDNTSNLLASELDLLKEKYRDNEESEEAVAAKSAVLEKQLQNQSDKVTILREALENSSRAYGDTADETVNLQIQLNNAERDQIKLERAIEKTNNALDNQAEEAEETIGQMAGLGDSIDSIADKLGIHIPDAAKNALNGIDGFSVASVAQMAAVAGAVAGVIKVMSELHQLTLEAAAQADALLTQSAQTGLDVELLQQLEYASNFLDFEGIDQSLVKLTNSMDKAREGAAAQSAAFETLEVSVTEADGSLRNNYDTFLDVIDALGQVENETERDTLANDLLGKSYSELKPLIQAGTAELKKYTDAAKENGHVLTESQVKILGEVDDAHQELQATIEATKKKIAVDFAPASKQAMETFAKAVKLGGDTLEETGIIRNTAALVENIFGVVDAGMDMIDALPSWINPLETVSGAMKGLAVVAATVADSMSLVGSLLKLDFHGAATALGWNLHKGEMSHLQQLKYSDPKYVSYNATGTDSWRGGLTWVGESGPELVQLPGGSRIYSNQESRQIAAAAPTDTRRLEQQQGETIEILRAIQSELAARRILERMR